MSVGAKISHDSDTFYLCQYGEALPEMAIEIGFFNFKIVFIYIKLYHNLFGKAIVAKRIQNSMIKHGFMKKELFILPFDHRNSFAKIF